MTARKELPEQLRGRAFAVREAVAHGLPEHRLNGRDLIAPFHGVRAPEHGMPLTLAARCCALSTRFRPADAFDGATAAALWGAPLPHTLGNAATLHVSSLAPRAALRRRGVRGTQRSAGLPVAHAAVPLMPPEHAWLTLAQELNLPDLVAVADFLVTGELGVGPVATLESLAQHLAARSGAPGSALARRALAFVRVGSWSRPESLLRVLLALAGLPEPVLNAPIAVEGERIVIPDIAFPQFGVAVEYNGIHHDAAPQRSRDLRRMDDLVEAGVSVVNVDRSELFGAPASAVARIVRRLRDRGWRGALRNDFAKYASLRP